MECFRVDFPHFVGIYGWLFVGISFPFLTLASTTSVSYHIIIFQSVSRYVSSAYSYRCTDTTMNRFTPSFLAATKQLYEWFSPSVRPSVCPSVTPFRLCSHHHTIMKFSGVITSDRSDVHAKGQGQRSKVKVTEVTTQLNRFGTVTPV